MSLRLNTTTDSAFAEILLRSLPNENRRKVVRKEVRNNTYGHELLLFSSCFPLLCVHYSSEVSLLPSFYIEWMWLLRFYVHRHRSIDRAL